MPKDSFQIQLEVERQARHDAESARNKLYRLQYVTSALAQALTPKEIAEIVVTLGAATLSASAGSVWLFNVEGHLHNVAYTGYKKEAMEGIEEVRQKDSTPTLDSIKKKKPIILRSFEDRKKLYPHTAKIFEISKKEGFIAIPLLVGEKALGAINFAFDIYKDFNADELEFMYTLTGQCSQALDRARLYQEEKESREKAEKAIEQLKENQKLAEELSKEIEKREARFRSLIENSSDAILLLDRHFHVLYRSQSSQRITGDDPNKILGKSVLSVVYKEDKVKVKKWLMDVVKNQKGKPSMLRFRRAMNTKKNIWIEAIATNFFHDPHIQAIVANYRDVTDKVESEEALRSSRDELNIILQNVRDGVVVTDTKGKVIYFNPAAVTFKDFSLLDSVKSLSYKEAITNFKGFYDDNEKPIPFQRMPIQRVLHGEKNVTQIMRLEYKDRKDDQWKLVKASSIQDKFGNISYIVSVYSDITQEKQKEKLKDEFISTASHELKTPITSAKLYAGLLQNRLEEIRDEKAFGILTKVDVQLDRLTRLINDLLDVSKISAGRVQLKLQNISLDQLVKDVIEEMQFTTLSHQIILSGSTNATIFADKERLSQVLMNLISNAIKYSPKSHRVDVIFSEDNTCLKVCVKDYGIGIRHENLKKIFEAFYRESHEKNARYPGLGLGLHISNEIIKRHNGTISVESIYGKGSTFCVTIPKVNGKNTYH